VLLIGDPTESLPQAAAEVERLCGLLDGLPGVQVTLLAGRTVRRVPLLAALQAHDVVHFAGHSHYDAEVPSRSGWKLGDGVLTASDLGRLHPPPLLVFSNSCEAAAGGPWEATYAGQVFGLGSAFLLAGVDNYVGTFWVVHDAASLDFATTCYRTLATGGRLGDALQAARTAVAAGHGPTGMTWASYVHYGDPAMRPFPEGPPRRDTSAAPAGARREAARFDVSLAGTAGAPVVGVAGEAGRLVGRGDELERLESALAGARAGTRQVVLVSGPAGIGKTALLDAFLDRVRERGDAWVAQGDAVEQYGAGEAYLPLLAALGRLGRAPDGRPFVDTLRRVAPSWLAQLPPLADARDQDALATAALGSSRERMLRELAELFEVATVARPLVLVLEDLHWSDRSTIEAIAYVARAHSPARLLLIGTYRSTETARAEHPLRAVTQELSASRRSAEIRLAPLDAPSVTTYLRERLGATEVDEHVTELVHARTDGHPLFLVNVVDFAMREALLRTDSGRLALAGDADRLRSGIPEGLRPMIERQIESLSPLEQRTLEAAAVAGAEFSIAALAAALEADADEIDDCCEGLAWRGQFLRTTGIEEWPDGTIAGRYTFVHALYRNVLYDPPRPHAPRAHPPADRRAEGGGLGRPRRRDRGELASHFEAARDVARAVAFRVRAGDQAVRRHADREAAAHFRRAEALLGNTRPGIERDQRELEVLVKLAAPLMSTAGYAAPEVKVVFDRAYALSRTAPASPYHAPLLRGLVSFLQVRGRHLVAKAVGEELLASCANGTDPIAQVQAHYGQGVTLFDLCELDAAVDHLRTALDGYDPATHPTHVSVYGGYDPGVACQCWLGWIHWQNGEFDRAVDAGSAALVLADRLGHRFTLVFACTALAIVHLQRGELTPAAELIERGTRICDDDGFHYQAAVLNGLAGWLRLLEGRPKDAVRAGRGLDRDARANGAGVSLPGFLNLLGLALLFSGDSVAARAAIDTGIGQAEHTGQARHLTSLYRTLARVIVIGGGDPAEAESWHRRGLALGRKLGVPIFELESATGLAEHLVATGRPEEARGLLEPLVPRFTEGARTTPMLAALAALAAARGGATR
jgi:tetratricopeptide (TPR) repeat protein